MIHTADDTYETEMDHINNSPMDVTLPKGYKDRSTNPDVQPKRNPANMQNIMQQHHIEDILSPDQPTGPTSVPVIPGEPTIDPQRGFDPGDQRDVRISDAGFQNPNIPHITINRDHDVPYVAGAAKDNDTTVYVDKELPKQVNISGVDFDPAHPAAMHELAEKPAMEYFTKVKGMSDEDAYELAHHAIANPVENTFYSAHGIDQKEVDSFWKTQDKRDEGEPKKDEPKDLYKKPYSHGDKPDKNFEEVWGPGQLNDKQKAALYDYHIASGAPTPPDPETQQIMDQAKFRNLLRYYMGPKKMSDADERPVAGQQYAMSDEPTQRRFNPSVVPEGPGRPTGGGSRNPYNPNSEDATERAMHSIHEALHGRPPGPIEQQGIEALRSRGVNPSLEQQPYRPPTDQSAEALRQRLMGNYPTTQEQLKSSGSLQNTRTDKLTLKKVGGVTGTDRERFHFVDEGGIKQGRLDLSTPDGGKTLHVDMVENWGHGGPNTLGPTAMRDILKQIKDTFPNAKTLEGFRVSGARERAGKLSNASIRLRK